MLLKIVITACISGTDLCRYSVEMSSSSKRKLVTDKSSSDEKLKPSVFDRLGPGPPTWTGETEVQYLQCNNAD